MLSNLGMTNHLWFVPDLEYLQSARIIRVGSDALSLERDEVCLRLLTRIFIILRMNSESAICWFSEWFCSCLRYAATRAIWEEVVAGPHVRYESFQA